MASNFNLYHVTNYPFMSCVLKVNTSSSWQRTVRKVFNKCHGVNNFRMNEYGFVEISGTIDPNILLKLLGRAGRKAEIRWFQFGECSSNLFAPIDYYTATGMYPHQDGRFLHARNISRPKPPQYLHDYEYNNYDHGENTTHYRSYEDCEEMGKCCRVM